MAFSPEFQIIKTPLRQYAPAGFFDTGSLSGCFTLGVGDLTHSLGQNNGHNGQVMTIANVGINPAFLFDFGEGATISFDHYAGMRVGNHLVANQSQAYFHVDIPGDPAHSGYFLYVIPTGDAALALGSLF